MLVYTIRRVLMAIPVMGIVAAIVFSLLYLTPGDPALVLAGDHATRRTSHACDWHSASTSRRTSASSPGCGRCCAAISAPRSSVARR